MAEVIEVNAIEQLAGYRLAASALLASTPRASFFHTLDWLEAYWRHYGAGQRLRALVVRAADQTIGIVPLVVRTRRSRVGDLRVLGYPLDHWGCWFSPLGANQAATLTLALRHIEQAPRDWDLVDLRWIDHAGADRGRTQRAIELRGWRATLRPDLTVSSVQTRGSFDGYLAGRSRKARHELRRWRRRVEEAGDVEFVRHRPAPAREGDGDPRWDLYDECEQVARRSWQARSTTGNTLCHAGCQAFLRDAHAAAARQGMVDLCLLRLEGRPAAFLYSYHRDGRVLGLRMGYDGGLGVGGLGTTLTTYAIEDGFARGDVALELGEGDEPYKHRLRTHVERTWRLMHTPIASWRGQAARLGRSLARLPGG